MPDGSIEIPRTLHELADLVRELRLAQRRVIWATDKKMRRERTERAMSLGRRMDLRLDLMSVYDRQRADPVPIPPVGHKSL